MARSITLNGTTYSIPQTGDSGWSQSGGVDDYLVALASGVLTKAGGTFTLAAETSLGATYGLKLPYIKTATAAPAAAGVLRLAKTDSVGWRNNADSADLALTIDGSDNLTFNGTKVGLSGNIVNADISSSAAIAYSKLALSGAIQNSDLAGSIAYNKLTLTGSIVDADVSASAAIAYTKLNLAGAVKLASDVTGLLPTANGGTGVSSTATFPTSGVVVTEAGTETLTNKTLTAPVISSIVNTGTLTLPTSTDTLVGRATTDTLTNKTLTAPVISTITNTGTLTLPTSTDTLVGRATTDTLTNKTISGASNTLTVRLANDVTGTLPIISGGTGQTTQQAAFNALSTLTTKGDLHVFDGTNNTRIAVGADGTVLSADSAQTTGLRWVSPLTNPMTAVGDLIVGGTSGAASRFAGNTTTTKNFLTQTGTGAASATPAWGTIASGDLPAATSSAQGAVSREASAVYSNGGTTLTWTGVTGAPATYNIRFVRTGSIVNVLMNFSSVTVSGTSAVQFGTIDAAFRPSVNAYALVGLIQNATTNGTVVVEITTAGNVLVYKDASAASAWANGNTTSTNNIATGFTYHIA